MANSKVLQAIVEIAGSVSPTLQKAVKETSEKLDKVNLKAAAIGAAAAAGAVAVGKAAIDAGKYLVDLGSQFDGVTDSIRIGTGATGEALDALMEDFDAVYSSVPTTMEDASKAIADYNTRLGLTGEELQGVSTQAIQVADMLGEDLGGVIESSSKAFQQWNIDAADMGGAMDYVFKVSQSTGVGFSELMETAQAFGPQLQKMGYSFEEATALIGQMEKAGVNTEEVLGAMKKSTAALAQEGIGASEGLDMYANAIINAKDMTQATAIATEVFGSRAASTMAAALRDGSISVDQLTESLMENEETISGCAADTYDYAEQLQLFKQKAQVALEPLAGTMFNALNDIMPVIGELFDGIIPLIQNLASTLVPVITGLVSTIVPMLSQLVPPIISIVSVITGKLIPPLIRIIGSVVPIIIELVEMLVPIIDIVVELIAATVTAIEPLIVATMEIIGKILPVITDLLTALVPMVVEIIDAILPVLLEYFDQLIPVIMEIIDAVLPVLVDLIGQLMPVISELIKKLLPPIVQLLSALLPAAMQIIDAVLPVLIEVLNILAPILDLLIGLLSPILDLFVQIVEPILNVVTMAIQPLIGILTTLISAVLEPLMPLIQLVADLFTKSLGSAIANIQPVIEALMGIFNNLIGFIQNVFAGNWSAAWENVVGMFKNYWEYLKSIFTAPINFMIDGINTLIGGLNKLTIPDWVPGIGGKGLDIPLIPKLATGGFTDGLSIAGEAGMEAVISFDPAYHDENVGYWMKAGKLLGVLDEVELNAGAKAATAASIQMAEAESGAKETPQITQAGKLMELDDFSLGQLTETTIIYYDFSGFSYAPQVEAGADADKEDIIAALKQQASEFFDWLEEWLRQKEVGNYDRVSIY